MSRERPIPRSDVFTQVPEIPRRKNGHPDLEVVAGIFRHDGRHDGSVFD
jgi:hypothetical protein